MICVSSKAAHLFWAQQNPPLLPCVGTSDTFAALLFFFSSQVYLQFDRGANSCHMLPSLPWCWWLHGEGKVSQPRQPLAHLHTKTQTSIRALFLIDLVSWSLFVHLRAGAGVCWLVWHKPASFLYIDKHRSRSDPFFLSHMRVRRLPVTWAKLPVAADRESMAVKDMEEITEK